MEKTEKAIISPPREQLGRLGLQLQATILNFNT